MRWSQVQSGLEKVCITAEEDDWFCFSLSISFGHPSVLESFLCCFQLGRTKQVECFESAFFDGW